jgi:pimeloyl-ACP methyl ester carboxylesterase
MQARPKRRGCLLRNTALTLGIALVLLIVGAIVWDAIATNRAATTYPPRGEFVTVDNSQMHVICRGSGSPTLVIQAGIAGGALDWLPVMDTLAASHRVCAFDRLGQDWSDPAPRPRTFATAAKEWHQAITALGIERPVVVGHSLGGAVVQIYAANYDVAGIVLVDGLTAGAAAPVVQRLGTYQNLNLLARAGLLRPLGALFADSGYPPELRAEMSALRSRSSTILNISAEGALAAETAAAELQAAEPQLNTPLLIVAAGANELPESEQFLEGLQILHRRHPDSTFVSIPDAKHYLIATHPVQVANIITAWIAEQGVQ